MWKRIYALLTICLLAAAAALWLIPSAWFSPDTAFGKSFFVASNRFETDLMSSVVTAARTNQKVVALTFDDGPDPLYTPQVLKILAEHDVKATFFVVGEDALIYPDLVIKEAQSGHEIENHTYTHPDLLKNTDLTPNEEIIWCHQVVADLTGRSPIYFRPPRRLFDHEILQLTDIYGYRMILWTICVESRFAKTPEDMAKRTVKCVSPGSIILAHDGHLDRSRTVNALPLIIESLKKKGYKFVTLEELLNTYDQSKHNNPVNTSC